MDIKCHHLYSFIFLYGSTVLCGGAVWMAEHRPGMIWLWPGIKSMESGMKMSAPARSTAACSQPCSTEGMLREYSAAMTILIHIAVTTMEFCWDMPEIQVLALTVFQAPTGTDFEERECLI